MTIQNKKISISLVIALSFLVSPVLVLAQNSNEAQTTKNGLSVANCFDYYRFGSVQVDVLPINQKVLAGSEEVFEGSVFNGNDYPIIDGSVYVKIFRKQNLGDAQSNGYSLVDQFFAVKGLNLQAKKTIPLSFKWKVSNHAINGQYYIATYFVSQDKFNLLGLSFTNDIAGNTRDFEIFGGKTGGVFLDKETVKINNNSYLFAGFTPIVKNKELVKIDLNLVNNTASVQQVDVVTELYSWDGLQLSNLVDKQQKQSYELRPNSTKALSYEVNNAEHPVYYLVVKATSNEASSILDIRFSREGVNWPRINFLGSTNYPLKTDVDNKIFSCVHNANNGDVESGQVVLSVLNSRGKELFKKTYSGKITSAVMGFADTFKTNKDLFDYTVKTDVYSGGKLVDTASIKYSCDTLSPENCSKTFTDFFGENKTTIVIIVLLILAVVVFSVIYNRRKMKQTNSLPPSLVLLFIAGSLATLVSLVPSEVSGGLDIVATTPPTLTSPSANSVAGSGTFVANTSLTGAYTAIQGGTGFDAVWGGKCVNGFTFSSGSSPEDPCDINGRGGWKPSEAYIGLDQVILSWNYGVDITVNGASVGNGSSVNIGDIIQIMRVPQKRQHVGWYATGGVNDTPFGYWGASSINNCDDSDKIGLLNVYFRTNAASSFTNKNFDAFFPVSFEVPSVSITKGGTATVEQMTSDTFKVTGSGTLTFNVNFSATTATGHLQYRRTDATYTCYTGNTTLDRTFNLPASTIYLSFNVNPPSNNSPYTPTVKLLDSCLEVGQNASLQLNSTDSDGDQIKFRLSFDGGPEQDTTFGNGSTIYSVSFATAGIKNVVVKAVDARGGISAPQSYSFEVKNVCTLKPPAWSASYPKVCGNKVIHLAWTKPHTAVVGYVINRRDGTSSSSAIASTTVISSGNTLSFDYPTPAVGQSYTFTIKANYGLQSSAESTAQTFVAPYACFCRVEPNQFIPINSPSTWYARESVGTATPILDSLLYNFLWTAPDSGAASTTTNPFNHPGFTVAGLKNLTVKVTSKTNGDFTTLSCSQSALNADYRLSNTGPIVIYKGGGNNSNHYVYVGPVVNPPTPVALYSGSVRLSTSTLPTGLKFTLAQNPVTPASPYATSNIIVSADATTPTGVYTINVQGLPLTMTKTGVNGDQTDVLVDVRDARPVLSAVAPPCSESGPGVIKLSWNPVSGATAYKIYRKTGQSTFPGDYQLISTITDTTVTRADTEKNYDVFGLLRSILFNEVYGAQSSLATTFKDVGLTPNSWYSYKISAVKDGIEGDKSDYVDKQCSVCDTLQTSCAGSPASANIGSPITWTATSTGETGSYDFSWDDSENPASNTSSPTNFVTRTYSSVGTKTMGVTVTAKPPTDGTAYDPGSKDVFCSVNITCPVPTVDLRVNGSAGPINLICENSNSQPITWTVTGNPDSCVASGKSTWIGPKPASPGGPVESGQFTESTDLTLTCSRSCGSSASDTVRVNVTSSQHGFAISANPSVIRLRQIKGAPGSPFSENATSTVSLGSCSDFSSPVKFSLVTSTIGGSGNVASVAAASGSSAAKGIVAVFSPSDIIMNKANYGTGVKLSIKPQNPSELLPDGVYPITIKGEERSIWGAAIANPRTSTTDITLIVETRDPGFIER